MNKPNILITGIGGPTTRSIALHLRELYPDAKLVGVDINPKALGFYLEGLLDKTWVVPRTDSEDYWPVMKEIVEFESIDLAFVQPEKEVIAWGKYYKENNRFISPTLIPPLEYAESLVNKAQMAELLADTDYIPKTVRIESECPNNELIEEAIGYPCWIRASEGSGGLGSLKLNRVEDLKAWLFIHKNIKEFTVSEYLTGRHLANQMLYLDGTLIKNAGLHCAEYVMADIAPSKVTGNTSYGRFINEDKLLEFCEEVIDAITRRLQVPPHGVFSFDLKEDEWGNPKVTEVNVRHMAYTGLMAKVGFDLIGDTVKYLTGHQSNIECGRFYYDSDYIFLRDVDINPIIMKDSHLLHKYSPTHVHKLAGDESREPNGQEAVPVYKLNRLDMLNENSNGNERYKGASGAESPH